MIFLFLVVNLRYSFEKLVSSYRTAEAQYIRKRIKNKEFSDSYIKFLVEKETAFEFAENCKLLPKTPIDQPIESPNRLSKVSLVRACVKIFAKQLANCVFFLQRSQKIDADVLYIRKKVQPDSVSLDDIEISLKASGIKFKAVHQNFGWGPSKHGINFVNGIGTFHLFLISQLRIVKIFWLYRTELYQNIHNEKTIVSLYNSLIQIQLLALLKAKILVGTFSDKSYFCC